MKKVQLCFPNEKIDFKLFENLKYSLLTPALNLHYSKRYSRADYPKSLETQTIF
jgi:hypothetical protein